MNIVYFFFLSCVSACECEVEPWNSWELIGDCGTAYEKRTRICSSLSGWKLGLGCNDDEHAVRAETRPKDLKACREFLNS